MEYQNACLITFSPTRTSYKIGEAITRGMGIPSVRTIDLTLQQSPSLEVGEDTVAVIVVPVYGGHVAPLAMERMQALRGKGAPAVVAVVYGNRAYEKALSELGAFVSGCGLKVVAAGTFVGEHSYSTASHPIAAGRPDAEDLKEAEAFGVRIAGKLRPAYSPETLSGADVDRIGRPSQPLVPLLRFLFKVLRMRRRKTPMPLVPSVDESLCTHCGLCAARCPHGAIRKGDECHTDRSLCIRCCACVKVCPHHASTFDTPFGALLSSCFSYRKANCTIL